MPFHAGSRLLAVPDAVRGVDVPVWAAYPTLQPAVPASVGGYREDVADDAPPAPGRHPVVIVSHGNGGSHLIYRALCLHLARTGHVVAALEHPGNNRRDNRLAQTLQNLVDRPRHVSLVLDALAAHPLLGPAVQPDAAAVAGHSFGGYTALAVAGGRPHARTGEPVPVQHDTRVRALVLLAPATPWYASPDALRAVRVPILLLRAEHDDATPAWHGDLVVRGVAEPALVTDVTVPGAGHFSFLSPFPAALVGPKFPPSMDPPGFDRAAFHDTYPRQVATFLAPLLRRAPVAA